MFSKQQKSKGGFAKPTNTTRNIRSNDAHCDEQNNALSEALLITTDVFTVNSEFHSAFAPPQTT
jgi:hypothetical protein